MPTHIILSASAGALLILMVLRRGLRHIRRIQVMSVSEEWLSEQKRQRDT